MRRLAHVAVVSLSAVALLACQGGKPSGPAAASNATPPAVGPQRVVAPPPMGAPRHVQSWGSLTVPAPPAPEGEAEAAGPHDGAKRAARQPRRLSTKSLQVKVRVEGRLARTEVTQVFENHSGSQTEGIYEFTLPEGAAISRLAMDVEGKLMEGELVERERARRIYESIVRRQKDPALLEWQGGNRFKTHVFPIPANGTKTVVLGYEQLLPVAGADVLYTYGLPKLVGADTATGIGSFVFTLESRGATPGPVAKYNARVTAHDGGHLVSLEQDKLEPKGPLTVRLTRDGAGETTISRAAVKPAGASQASQLFMIDHIAAVPGASQAPPDRLFLAVDTSAGVGAVELDRVKAVARELAQQHKGAKVHTVRGDVTVNDCEGTACLERAAPGGATDLDALLRRAGTLAAAAEGRVAVVLFSDGVASLGELDADLIRSRYANTVQGKDVTLHTVAVGHAPDSDTLRRLARRGGGHALTMRPVDPTAHVARLVGWYLQEPVVSGVTAKVVAGEVDGLVPATPTNLARGESLAVMGRLRSASATIEVSGRWAGRIVSGRYEVGAQVGADNALLPAFWARGHIADLQRGHADRAKVTALSLEYGVMSRYTSFLVLENEAAYKRFEVARRKDAERQAKATAQREAEQKAPEALRKGTGSLQDALKEVAAAPPAEAEELTEDDAKESEAPPSAAPAKLRAAPAPRHPEATKRLRAMSASGEPSGAALDPFADGAEGGGFVGSASVGGSGGGGTGRGLGIGRKARPDGGRVTPIIKLRPPTVTGDLDAALIRHIIRRFSGQLRGCYQEALQRDPWVRGELTLSLVILPNGRVAQARALGRSLSDAKLNRCLAGRMKRWRFPQPRNGGIVKVETPATFTTRGGPAVPPEEVVKALSTRKDLSNAEVGRLLAALVALKRDKEVDRRFGAFREALVDGDAGLRTLREMLADQPTLQARWPAVWVATLKGLLDDAEVGSVSHSALWSHLVAAKQWSVMATVFAQHPGSSPVSRLVELEEAAQATLVDQLLASWSDAAKMPPLQRVRLLGALTQANQRHGTVLIKAAGGVLRGDSAEDAVEAFALLVSLGVGRGQDEAAAREMVAYCERKDADLAACREALGKVASYAPAKALIGSLDARRIDQINTLRRSDVGNPDLITEHAAFLRERGDGAAADRLLSEIVEFAPHDFAARRRYSRELAALKRVAASCGQLAAAVQLNPGQRDTFRQMMAMRRHNPGEAKAIRSCIVDGVSKLPVQRAVSLVMTWEDPSADVDLHIHEPGGEHVFYSSRESRNGGFLYYDITDGFGPEIYTLGQGPKGEYKLTIVYYSGGEPNLKGTLTVLRNAGSPEETREDRPFVLKGANSSVEVPVGSLTL